MLKNLKKRKGFTLIELIVVMAIIAILVLLAAPKYLNYTKDAHVTAMQQDAKVLSNIALGYNVKNDGVYPLSMVVGTDGLPNTHDDVVKAVTIKAVATANEVDLDDINKALGATLTLSDLAELDATKVSGSLQGLKNNLSDYLIVTNGTHEGEIIYKGKVLTNSDGVKFISVSPSKDQAIQ